MKKIMANEVVGKITRIEFLNKNRQTVHHLDVMQKRHDAMAMVGNTPKFSPLKVDARFIQGMEEAVYVIRSFSDGPNIVKAFSEMLICLGDIIITGNGVICGVEFVLGGMFGINPNGAIVVSADRSVSNLYVPETMSEKLHTIFRKPGILASRSYHKEPLEIQTNGGVMGSKDTYLETLNRK
jgi:hypothetical protein